MKKQNQTKIPKDNAKDELIRKFLNLKANALKKGISKEEVKRVFSEPRVPKRAGKKGKCENGIVQVIFDDWVTKVAAVVAVLAIGVMFFHSNSAQVIKNYSVNSMYKSKCLIKNWELLQDLARPITDCRPCHGLRQVPVEYDISPELFAEKYAYSNIPVLIKDATVNWTAMATFSYDYFKQLYTKTNNALARNVKHCQFFPYKTKFRNLSAAFKMSEARASFVEGEEPWYIGWSNCDSRVAKILRKHYNRPHFLPVDSESSRTDWIFMGGSGLGAHIHIDVVDRPSWQAQVSGAKTWTLIPTPECETVCHSMNVTVSKGDIIVVDTNQWYHSTFTHPGEISIAIGSEFD